MSAQVVCPHCGKTIKLRDRSLLGKKGKCPGCAKSFLLQEQAAEEEVIPLQLADEEPALGTGAKWVPDDPVAPPAGQFPIAYVPVQTPQGIVLTPMRLGQIPGYPTAAIAPQPVSLSPVAAAALPAPGLPDFNFDLGDDEPVPASSTSSALPSSKRPVRKTRGNTSAWIGVVVAALCLGGGAFYLNSQTPPGGGVVAVTPAPQVPATGTGIAETPSPPGADSRESLSANPQLVAAYRPTHGEPIPLNMLTGTNNILIHLRPERIWGSERAAAELKASLTEDVVNWLEAKIKKVTRRTPNQIEEILIGISVVSKVEPPQISTVFRLKTPEKPSALILEFNGTEISMPDKPLVTKKDAWAFHVKDDRTIAICPAELGGDLSDAVAKPLECVTDGIAELLKASDRQRSLTVLMDVTDSLTYADQLFEPSAMTAMTKLLEWFGPDAETVSWSVNLGSSLHSEIRVRPKGSRSGTAKISTADSLKKDYLQRLPMVIEQDLVNAVRVMRPTRSGFRQIIGRFPAMVEAFRQATILHAGPTYLTMTTVLPLKAAPNLALGTVLTWDESTRTNFGSSESEMPMASTENNLAKTVMGRLKTEFEIEFSRKPLADAIAYLADETKVTFVIDGDALKMAGYTKNMPQTFSLGKAPGTKGIHTILTWPMQEKMCLVINDAKMEALLTTTAAAEAQGLQIVPVDTLK